MKPGLVSITFRQLSPPEIIDLVCRAGLSGIEWGGDVHVPHGDTERAHEVRRLTAMAGAEHIRGLRAHAPGVSVAAYGSYYRVGQSEDEGLSFTRVLHTAISLNAPLIRVWAGTRNSEGADDKYFKLVVNEMRYICEKAAQSEMQIATEFHGGTLCDTSAATRRLIEAVDHPNLKTLWQPPDGMSTQEAADGLREVLPYLSNLHVFRWDGQERRPLEEGEAAWREYFSIAKNQANWALLEFVKNDDPEQFLRDAATLKSWLDESGNASDMANPKP